MGRFVRAGAFAGAIGGLALALFLRLVGEGTIGEAVSLERARNGVHHEMFSRGTQQVGGMLGAVVYGVFMGVVFAVILAAVRHRMASRDDVRRARSLAVVGFVTIALVPFLKYPANPPAVGSPDTIGRRTALYLVILAWSIVTTWAAWRLWTWLATRPVSEGLRVAAATALGFAMVALAFVLLPGSPDPVRAPANLIWHFRIASIGGAAVYWFVVGTATGAALQRTPQSRRVESASPVG